MSLDALGRFVDRLGGAVARPGAPPKPDPEGASAADEARIKDRAEKAGLTVEEYKRSAGNVDRAERS
jgi:hypothetical protein